MKKANQVMQPIKKPIKRVGNWCAQLWDGVSGKDSRRIKQLRQTLVLAQQNAATLTQELEQSQQQCVQLQQDLEHHKHQLENSQHAFKDSQQKFDQLWQELDELVADSDQQIQILKTALNQHSVALANCEAALHRSPNKKLVHGATAAPIINLANWKIGFVGGHDATRRVVTQTLQTEHGLVHPPVEIPPHHDVNISQKQLKKKLADCDLVVSIVRYSSHALTKSLNQLKDKGALEAPILIPNSRGVSGVVRDILSFVGAHQDLAGSN